jgi:hypothetical protein
VWDSNSYTLVTTIPNISYIAIYLDNNLNLLYGQNYVASTLDVIDCQTNTLISSEPATAPLGFYPVYNSSNGNIVLWQQLGANIAAQLTLPSVTFSTDGIPTYPQLVESMYGFNPYQFTKLYISTSTLSQINQPLTINYTFPDGRLNTDLRFPVISPLQRQFVISEFDLNMTANGQSNLQYTVLPNTDVTLIFTYKQPSSGENIEEVETLYEDVTEKFKQLEISRKNNPLTDMKWDI